MPGSLNESLLVRLLAPDHAGHEPRDGLDEHQGGQLPAREHVVADRDLLGGKAIDDTLVHTLVAPAQER